MSSYPIADFYAQVLSPAQQPLVSGRASVVFDVTFGLPSLNTGTHA